MNLFFLSNLENKPAIKICIAVFITINAVVLALLVFGPERLFAAGTGGQESAAEDSTQVTVYVEPIIEGQDSENKESDASDEQDTAVSPDEQMSFAEAGEEDAGFRNEFAGIESDTAGTSRTAAAEEEEMPATGPVLILTDDHVTLHIGDSFNLYDYIRIMRDQDGSDLSHYIHLDGYVNTYVPGDYPITYRITSPISGETASKELLVTVE